MEIEGIYIRHSLVRFVKQMELKLRENDHKGGWENSSTEYLFDSLCEEVDELQGELSEINDPSDERVKGECLDVANFAMMLFDNKS